VKVIAMMYEVTTELYGNRMTIEVPGMTNMRAYVASLKADRDLPRKITVRELSEPYREWTF